MKIVYMLVSISLIGVFMGCSDSSKQNSLLSEKSDWLGSIAVVDQKCTLKLVAQGPQAKNAVHQAEMQSFEINRPCKQFVDTKLLKLNEQQRLEFADETHRVPFAVLEGMMQKVLGSDECGPTSRPCESEPGIKLRYQKRMDGEGGGGPANTPPDKLTRPGQ